MDMLDSRVLIVTDPTGTILEQVNEEIADEPTMKLRYTVI
jgi:hypothetical protein